MFNKDYTVLEIINKNSSISQRDIASKANVSLGNANTIIRRLIKQGYISVNRNLRKLQYIITEEGIKVLENHMDKVKNRKIIIPYEINKKIKQGVILAAGEREGFKDPVGLLPLGKNTVIGRIIDILQRNGIKDIFIITGYESSYFERFKEKGVYLIKNEKYKWTGTMASLSMAKEYITDDFLLIEGDMFFEEDAVVKVLESENRNCVLITSESGSGDEVFVEIRDGFITKISKDKHQFNRIDGEMIGISKISIDIYRKMLEEYKDNKNPFFNYEYALMDVSKTYDIGYVKAEDLIWTEIEKPWQYEYLKKYMYPFLTKKESKGE